MKFLLSLTILTLTMFAQANTQKTCSGIYNSDDQIFLGINDKNALETVVILNLDSSFGNMNGFEIKPVKAKYQYIKDSTRYELLAGSGYFLTVTNNVLQSQSGTAFMENEFGQSLKYLCR